MVLTKLSALESSLAIVNDGPDVDELRADFRWCLSQWINGRMLEKSITMCSKLSMIRQTAMPTPSRTMSL